MLWLAEPGPAFDAAIVDFPDPHSFAVGKLLRPVSIASCRSGSRPTRPWPCNARRRFSPAGRTGASFARWRRPGSRCGLTHAAVPSFGVWGFALARRTKFEIPREVPAGLKFLTSQSLPTLFVLPADLGPLPVEINRLDNQVLVRYHDVDWRKWD